MIDETFVASSPQNAYALAVEKYGSDIRLISARQLKYNDGELRSEITVAVPQALFYKASLIDTPIKPSEETLMLDELHALKSQIDTMKVDLKEDIQGSQGTIQEIKSLFVEKGISLDWIEQTLSSLVTSEIIDDPKLLAAYLIEEIDEALQIKEEELSQRKIMMIVGPTGVGKTTTIAKLAARYTFLLDKKYKVALVNLDTFKIGAIEQLGHYATMMQLEHIVVHDIENFQKTLDDLSDYDVILVDTAGMSPYDTEKFIQTAEYLHMETSKILEVSLLLPATVKYEDMEDIYQNFSFLNLDALIISKFDETKHLGTLLNFMLRYDIPMSYFTNGQEVPEDLIIADKEYLLEQFIGDINAV